MMQNIIEFSMAFLAGFLSFLSPCVLPLLPSFLSILAGNAKNDDALHEEKSFKMKKNYIFARSIAFTFGFTVIFVVLGIVFSQAGMILGNGIQILSTIAGIFIIILGINTIVNLISFLNIEKRFHFAKKPSGFVSCVLFGAAFGAGWSPCVGPMLASILFMAGTTSVERSAFLLTLYSLGLALPFMFAALLFSRLEGLFQSIKKRLGTINIISGILLIIIGLYMMFGKIRTIAATFSVWASRLENFSQNNPFISDLLFSLIFIAIFMVLIILRIKKRKELKVTGEIKNTSGLVLFIFGIAFGILAILEAADVISTPELIASWFRFQGI
jgi:cytochrome c-type biogenesis protein